ncbi:MAG: arginine--tRNA ligase [bacterium]
MIRNELKDILQKMLPDEKIIIDNVPKDKQGDYSTNVAFKIASRMKVPPYQTAEKIAAQIRHDMIADVSIHKPAFINFTISSNYILKKLFGKPERLDFGKGQRILIEFVSANPTGPINIASARAAAVGDSIIKLLNRTGYHAVSEYYVNDGGRQSQLLAESIQQRIEELNGKIADIPEGGYHGEYLVDLARMIKQKNIEGIDNIKKYAINYFVDEHIRILKRFGVEFQNWTRESSIHKKGFVKDILAKLNKKNLIYNKEGAIWLKTTDYGDKEDRVIVTTDKRHTYLLPDIAYHIDKIHRKHDRLINIWGPDHQAQIKSLQSSITALGYPDDILDVLIVQQVHIKEAGKLIKMSKRAGSIKTLEELLDNVPKDVVRFFLLMRSNSQHLDFDLDLALKESDENPVYYVQYAYARIKSIIKKAQEQGLEYNNVLGRQFLKENEEIILAKAILKYHEVLEDAVRNLEPYMLTYYLIDLARTFHYFYQKLRVISDDKQLTQARLALINRTGETIKNGLDILGVSCPERM